MPAGLIAQVRKVSVDRFALRTASSARPCLHMLSIQ